MCGRCAKERNENGATIRTDPAAAFSERLAHPNPPRDRFGCDADVTSTSRRGFRWRFWEHKMDESFGREPLFRYPSSASGTTARSPRAQSRTDDLIQATVPRSVMLPHSAIGVTVHSPTGELLTCNRATGELLGRGESCLRGRKWPCGDWGVRNLDGHPVSDTDDPVQCAAALGEPVRAVLAVGTEESGEFVLEIEADPRRDDSGRVEQVICSFTRGLRLPSEMDRAVVNGAPRPAAADPDTYRAISDAVTDGVCLLTREPGGDIRV